MPRHTGCRDCTRCTESALTGCLLAPFRILFSIFTVWGLLGARKCPQCGHPLKWHQRDATGRFAD